MFFVHGLACDATDWRAQVDAFSPTTTVAACDLPGHGASPAGPADCTIEAYGRAVAAAVTELRVPPAILVGHSMGCRVVLAANRASPDAVAGLVLVDGSRIGAGDPEAAGQAMADEVAGDGYLRFMRQFFESMFVPSSDRVLARAIVDRALRMPAPLGRPLLRDLAGWDAAEVLLKVGHRPVTGKPGLQMHGCVGINRFRGNYGRHDWVLIDAASIIPDDREEGNPDVGSVVW